MDPSTQRLLIGRIWRHIIVLTAAWIICTHLASATEASLPEILEKVNPDVVQVYSYDEDGNELAQGTGFFLTPSTIITCYHVIDTADIIGIETAEEEYLFVDSIGTIDFYGDLAKLWVTTEEAHAGLTLAKEYPRQGERVIVVGNPLGFRTSISDGLVAAVRELEGWGKIIQITAPISPGSSGSPVINTQGQVIGVAAITMVEGQNVNFAISFERIRDIDSLYASQLDELLKMLPDEDMAGDLSRQVDPFENARSLLEAGDLKSALYEFENLIDEDPGDAFAHFYRALCLFRMGRYKLALRGFNDANRLHEMPETHYNLSLCYERLGDTSSAIREAEQATQLDPVDADYLFQMGELSFYAGNYTLAIKGLSSYDMAAQNDEYAHLLLAFSYYSLERYDSAAGYFQEYLQKNPEHLTSHRFLGYALEGMGDYRSALTHLRKVAAADSCDCTCYITIAECEVSLGDSAAALLSYSRAIRQDSDNALARNDYGVLLQNLGRWRDALEQYQTAARLDASSWLYQWNIGNLCIAMGRSAEGDRALRRARELKDDEKDKER